MVFFINSDFIFWNFFFSCYFKSVFVGKKLKNHLPADLISDFSENTTLEYVLFYLIIRKTISQEFSPILLFRIPYPVTTNPTMYMMNKIPYVWKLKISSSFSALVTKKQFFNTCGYSVSKTSRWSSGTWAWANKMNHESFEFDWGSSRDLSWHQALCRQCL